MSIIYFVSLTHPGRSILFISSKLNVAYIVSSKCIHILTTNGLLLSMMSSKILKNRIENMKRSTK